MSFFNLTQVGLQNPIKEVTDFESSSPSATVTTSSESLTTSTVNVTETDRERDLASAEVQQAVEQDQQRKTPLERQTMTHVEELYGRRRSRKEVPVYTSQIKYAEKHHKHQRNVLGPNELYKRPLTTTQDYGRWLLEKKETDVWTYQKRHAHVNSEMTRFVDEMGGTNKEFTLF